MNTQFADCETIQPLIFELVDARAEEASTVEYTEVQRHLQTCEECQQLMREEQQLSEWLSAGSATSRRSLTPASATATTSASRWWLAALAIVLLVAVGIGLRLRSDGPLGEQPALGTIVSRSMLTPVKFSGEHHGRSLGVSNHVEFPAGVSATIDLAGTGQLQVMGPATLEIDHLVDRWKVTLLDGQLTARIDSGQRLMLAGKDGLSNLTNGVCLVSSGQRPESLRQEQEDARTPAELMDEAFGAFHQTATAGEEVSWERCAELLKSAIDHPEITGDQRHQARYYRAAALSNAGMHAEAKSEALQWCADHPDEFAEVMQNIIASAWLALGDRDKATEIWQKILEHNPDSPYRPYIEAEMGTMESRDPDEQAAPQPAGQDTKAHLTRQRPPYVSERQSADYVNQQGDGYLVVTVGLNRSQPEHRKFASVADQVVEFHDATRLDIQPGELQPLRESLVELRPANVLFVIPPELLDVNFHRQVLMMSPTLENDLFADFCFGYLTARDGDAVQAFWDRMEQLHQTGLKNRTWIETAVTSSSESFVNEDPNSLSAAALAAGFSGKNIYFAIIEQDADVLDFVAKQLPELEAASVITMTGNGDPQGIWLFDDSRNADPASHWPFDPQRVGDDRDGKMPRILASQFADLHLDSPIIWSGTCHSGACRKVFVEGDIVSTFGSSDNVELYELNPDESMALALIDAGAGALLVPIASNHGYSTLSETAFGCQNGASLGEIIKSTYDDVFYQADGIPNLLLVSAGDPHDYHSEPVMQGAGANRILIGDPALRLFDETKVPGEQVAVTSRDDGQMTVDVVWEDGFHPLGWNIYTNDYQNASRRIAARIPAPDGMTIADQAKLAVTVKVQDRQGRDLTFDPTATIEQHRGQTWLHLQATSGADEQAGYQHRKATFELTW